MEGYSQDQVNVLLYVGVYLFIIFGMIWNYSKPKK
jgi:hypothetical protein